MRVRLALVVAALLASVGVVAAQPTELEGILQRGQLLLQSVGGSIFVVVMMWLGIKYKTSQGSVEKLLENRRAVVSAIAGLALLLGAPIIKRIVVWLVTGT